MSGELYEVVAVMPGEIDQIDRRRGGGRYRSGFTPAQLALYDEFYLSAYARQRKDVSVARVKDEFARIAQTLSVDHPGPQSRAQLPTCNHSPFYHAGEYRLRLLILLAAVALVLLIACGNVANLLLARGWRSARASWRSAPRSARAAAGSCGRC